MGLDPRIAGLCEWGEKGRWACVALGGRGPWPASASVALAERSFSLTPPRSIYKTRPSVEMGLRMGEAGT
jgi:hypothetical protein